MSDVALWCRAERLPEPLTEFRFAAPRRWRFDYAWPLLKVALEVEGGVFIAGRHARGAGMLKDMEKYNTAALEGWMVLRCTPQALLRHETLQLLSTALRRRAA